MSTKSLATVSANTLFHFTRKIDYLTGILTNNFYPRFCLENHSAFFSEDARSETERAFPMVCFCDIPLSNIRKHIGDYGEYAIGLTKQWGTINGISPVMYFENESTSVKVMKSCFQVISERIQSCHNHSKNINIPLHKRDDKDKKLFLLSTDLAGIYNGLIKAMGFTKQYRGTFYRNGEERKDVCFYDEREWRYVPDILDLPEGLPPFISKETYLDEDKKLEENSKFERDEISLKFTPKDIRYIILSKEKEILPMVEKIATIKGQKYSHNDIELLKTRIISMERIIQDF